MAHFGPATCSLLTLLDDVSMHSQRDAPPVSPTRCAKAAAWLTELFAPVVVMAATILVMAWHSSDSIGAALLWGGLGIALAAAVPFSYLLRGVRRGRWGDHHVPDRASRVVPMLVGIGCVVVLLAIYVVADAPRDMLALVASMVAGGVVTLAITKWWKISIHAAVAAAAVAVLVIVFGAIAGSGAVVVAAVGWSRVQLKSHTVPQVVAGALLGMVIAAAVFANLR